MLELPCWRGASGCRIEIAPPADEADVTDQQGFPVKVITVPVASEVSQ